MPLTLLLPLRGRRDQAASMLPVLAAQARASDGMRVVVVESDRESVHAALCRALRIDYHFDRSEGPFHKSRLLNLALARAPGDRVAPYDVDLLPRGATLRRHAQLSAISPRLLVTGYRLMTPAGTAPPDPETLLASAAVGPENGPSALRKWLVDGERFGVVPHFDRRRLEAIGGWDEAYVGWGAEDQDVIERYLADEVSLVASPDLVYLHLAHPPDASWAEDGYVAANRARYYAARAPHPGGSPR